MNLFKNRQYRQFWGGMLVMMILTTLISPVKAATQKIDFNQVGIRVLRQQKIMPGDMYTAPNGQRVPSTITYTDAAGGKTNYVSIRNLSELIDADICWNEDANSVDVGVLTENDGYVVNSSADGDEDRLNAAEMPQYGRKIGALTEVNPESVDGLFDGRAVPSRSYAYNTRIQYGMGSLFPEITVTAKPTLGKWLVFSVTNNGKTIEEMSVSRKVTLSTGRREAFPNVIVEPGETAIRAFRIDDNADVLKSSFGFSVHGIQEKDMQTDVTVSILLYPE